MAKKGKSKRNQSPPVRLPQGKAIPDADKHKPTMDEARVAQQEAAAAKASSSEERPATDQSLAQLRAKCAYRQIRGLVKLGAGKYGGYAPYVRSLPAKIMMSGLGQALAMEKAQGKKKPGHEYLYKHMNKWLTKRWSSSPYKGQPDIVSAIIKGAEEDYLRAQMEAMEYLVWLKKFSDAELETAEGADDD